MSDQRELEGYENVDVDVIEGMISTTITLSDGTRVRMLSSEKATAQMVLAYRQALIKLHNLREPDREP